MKRWVPLLENTLGTLLVSLALSLTLAVVLAVILFKTDVPLRKSCIALLVCVAAFPLYVVGAALIGLTGEPVQLENSVLALGLVHGLAHLPLVILLGGLALSRAPRTLEEAAICEGASIPRVLYTVTLRGALPGFLAAALLTTLWVTGDYSASDTLLVRTFAEEVYTQFALYGRVEEPALVGLPQAILIGVLLWYSRRFFLSSDGALASAGPRKQFRLGRARYPLSTLCTLTTLFIAGAPITVLLSKLDPDRGLQHFVRVFLPELQTSLWTSLLAGACCALLAVGIAWYAVRSKIWRFVVSLYAVVVLATPPPVLGIGLIQLLNHPDWRGAVYDSPMTLVIAYTLRFLPLAVLILVPAIRSISPDWEHAARVDGATKIQVWARIILPLCLPAMLVSFFLVTALSLGEVPCSLLVTPPGYQTVGARFFSLIHYGLQGEAAALCLLAVGLVLIPAAGLLLILRRHPR
jgi:iron(III) transport system permease protein